MDCFFGFGSASGPSIGSLLFYTSGGFALPFWSIGIIIIFISGLVLLQNNEEAENTDLKYVQTTE